MDKKQFNAIVDEVKLCIDDTDYMINMAYIKNGNMTYATFGNTDEKVHVKLNLEMYVRALFFLLDREDVDKRVTLEDCKATLRRNTELVFSMFEELIDEKLLGDLTYEQFLMLFIIRLAGDGQ